MTTWKAIGKSVIGTSHVAAGKPCDDSLSHTVVRGDDEKETLICCVSDGAGSATHAAFASAFCTENVLRTLTQCAQLGTEVGEATIFAMLEDIYDKLSEEAEPEDIELNEYSCTLLGCYISPSRAVFFQVGDGAIVRNDASGFYIPVWMPENGEYQNSTSFVIDDRNFNNLKISIIEQEITEVALFTDGLQMLALNMETASVHQPFFTPLFKYLRLADDAAKTDVLQRKLAEYLGSNPINDRTDDDKTLFLATRAVNL